MTAVFFVTKTITLTKHKLYDIIRSIMKNNTNTQNEAEALAAAIDQQLNQDIKHAILIVSLLANVFILLAWIALQVTTVYDYEVAKFLFYR